MGDYLFTKDGGGEQSYGIIEGAKEDELVRMVTCAIRDDLDPVAIIDAECDTVMITTRVIANLLLPILNKGTERDNPLYALNFVGHVVPPLET